MEKINRGTVRTIKRLITENDLKQSEVARILHVHPTTIGRVVNSGYNLEKYRKMMIERNAAYQGKKAGFQPGAVEGEASEAVEVDMVYIQEKLKNLEGAVKTMNANGEIHNALTREFNERSEAVKGLIKNAMENDERIEKTYDAMVKEYERVGSIYEAQHRTWKISGALLLVYITVSIINLFN